ncbi:Formin-binding protein 1 [Rhizophlyctis rosea]|nr:Formin-binding protein 1 [Rhizophlyctis rosea]
MGFGAELWDQWKQVEQYCETGIEFTERFNEFLKKRAEIEADYAKSLQKLVRTHKDELAKKNNDKGSGTFQKAVQSGTVAQSWSQLLNETDNLATCHLNVSTTLDADLRKSVKAQARENEKLVRQRFDDIRKAIAEYKRCTDNLEKVRGKYERAMKDMETAKMAYETASQDMNTTKKDIEKLRNDAEKKALLSQEATKEYKDCIAETNEKKSKHYNESLPSILDEVQREDETNRIAFLKTSFTKYADTMTAQLEPWGTATKSMTSTFGTISPSYDEELFVKLMKTNEALPPDFTFEEKTFKDATTNRKTSMRGFTKAKDDLDEGKDDAIVTLPAKQGRKKAAERIKQLDKELAETEKKRQGVETLMGVYKDKAQADPAVNRDLNDQREALIRRGDTILLRKHKLAVYIASVDGTPLPEAPASIRDRADLNSPITPFSDTSSTSGLSLNERSPQKREAGTPQSVRMNELEQRGNGNVSGMGGGVTGSPGGGGTPKAERVLCRAKVLYNFEAQPDSQELEVKSGDILEVLEKQDDGYVVRFVRSRDQIIINAIIYLYSWWRVRVARNGVYQEGYVPG